MLNWNPLSSPDLIKPYWQAGSKIGFFKFIFKLNIEFKLYTRWRFNDTIEHALCYCWVDSKAKNMDAESTYLKFTPRNPKSKWSKGNIERAKRLIANGFMTPYGHESIEIAKSN